MPLATALSSRLSDASSTLGVTVTAIIVAGFFTKFKTTVFLYDQ